MQSGSTKSDAATHVDWVCPLVLVKVTVQNDINTVLVQDGFHGFSHALVLQVVGGVCISTGPLPQMLRLFVAMQPVYNRIPGLVCACHQSLTVSQPVCLQWRKLSDAKH